MPPPPKSDAPAAPAKIEKTIPAPEPPSAAAGPKPAAGLRAWIPAVAALAIAPGVTWAVARYVIVPRLEHKLSLPPPVPVQEVAAETTKDGKPKEAANYEFSNVVVNLAGTMGTRYLKTSFVVVGDPKSTEDLKKTFDTNHTKLYDTTLNVLSSLTLADLEEAGAKNVIREKLVSAYNQALGKRVAEQVYFSDFVVQ